MKEPEKERQCRTKTRESGVREVQARSFFKKEEMAKCVKCPETE